MQQHVSTRTVSGPRFVESLRCASDLVRSTFSRYLILSGQPGCRWSRRRWSDGRQYAASADEATIQAGIDTVRKILADHYVHRNQSELGKSTIRERGRHRIIDKVTATLNEKDEVYQAEFANLGIKGMLVEPVTIKAHPKLLVGGSGVSATSSISTPTTHESLLGSSARSSRSSCRTSTLRATWLHGGSSPATSGSTCSCSPSGSTPSCSAGGPSSSNWSGSSRSSSEATTSSSSAPRARASRTSSRSSRRTACSSPAARSPCRSCSSTTPTGGLVSSVTGRSWRSTSSPARRSARTRRSSTS